MTIETVTVERQTTAGTDILDITDAVVDTVRKSGVKEGQVLVFVPGSTAAVTTIEFEPGVVHDLAEAIERMAPSDMEYAHNARWGDGNGYSHVRAALLGASLVIPVVGGRVVLGTWQQVVLCDFDNRPRSRRVVIQVTGQ